MFRIALQVLCNGCSVCPSFQRKHKRLLSKKLKSAVQPHCKLLTLYFSFANNTEALWNLQRGFLGSILIALFKVSKAFSDFFRACWTWKRNDLFVCFKKTVLAHCMDLPISMFRPGAEWSMIYLQLQCGTTRQSSEGWYEVLSGNAFLQGWISPVCSKSFPTHT